MKIPIPADKLAYAAYFNAREQRTIDIEGPDDTDWVIDWNSESRLSQIVDNVGSGEWVNDHVELEGTMEITGGWIIQFELEYYPSEDNAAYAFIRCIN